MTARRSTVRALLSVALASGIVLSQAPPASATFHLMKVREVFVGTSEHPDAHYVELQMYAGQQRFVNGHEVRVFDSAGDRIATFTFSSPVLNGADQSSILIATPEAQSFFGVGADLQMTAVIPRAGGKVCFDNIDCVSWGSYSGSAGGTGTPFNQDEGLVPGAAILRDIGKGNGTELDAADDSGDSWADFEFAPPAPRNNAGTVGKAPGGDLAFSEPDYEVAENEDPATITVERAGGTGSVSVGYSTEPGSATLGADYTPASGVLELAEGETSKSFTISIDADGETEGDETVRVLLRGTTGDAALGLPDATLTITDAGGGDTTAPESTIDKPAHSATYKPGKLGKLKGTATDEGSGVASLEVALRKKKENGNCAWFDGSGFTTGGCSEETWLDADGAAAWTYALGTELASSKGTKTRSYTAYSRATDASGNVESNFAKGRNKNTFEIK